jgi:hypothetical protein
MLQQVHRQRLRLTGLGHQHACCSVLSNADGRCRRPHERDLSVALVPNTAAPLYVGQQD